MDKLQELRNKKNELVEKSQRADISADELKAILDEIKAINEKIKLIEDIIKEKEEGNSDNGDSGNTDGNGDGARNDESGEQEPKRFKPVMTNETRGAEMENLEYRKAFRNLVSKGIAIPQELRAVSSTSDVEDVIPQNLIAQIIDKSRDFGMIFKAVTKTSYAVGQEYPIASFRPIVNYVDEGKGSENQKASTEGKISFNGYKADCRIAWTEETDRMTLDVWEKYFVEKVVEAITIWKENEIINGESGKITGILSQTATFNVEKDTLTYSDLLELEGNLPSGKDSGAKWYMSKKTFFNTFKNILDEHGNPVASLDHGTDKKIVPYILGREVVYCDEYMPNHNGSGTKAKQVTAFMFDMKDYVFNENYNLGMQRRVNWETDDHELKCVFRCDGKPLDTDSLITVSRATDVA